MLAVATVEAVTEAVGMVVERAAAAIVGVATRMEGEGGGEDGSEDGGR